MRLTCPHQEEGECRECWKERVASIGVPRGDPGKQRKWDSRLERYRRARKEGIQPRSTRSKDIDIARKVSDETQTPYSARTGG